MKELFIFMGGGTVGGLIVALLAARSYDRGYKDATKFFTDENRRG